MLQCRNNSPEDNCRCGMQECVALSSSSSVDSSQLRSAGMELISMEDMAMSLLDIVFSRDVKQWMVCQWWTVCTL